MTAGVGVPLVPGMLDDVLDEVPYLARREPRQVIGDRRFAEALYRLAIRNGTMERMIYQDAASGSAVEP